MDRKMLIDFENKLADMICEKYNYLGSFREDEISKSEQDRIYNEIDIISQCRYAISNVMEIV